MLRAILGSILRLATLAALVLTVLAILLARANPEQSAERTVSSSPIRLLAQFLLPAHEAHRSVRLWDVETGRHEALSFRPGMNLDWASLSPWSDHGVRQVVGLGRNRPALFTWGKTPRVTLVRMTLPDCEVLDEIDFTRYSLPESEPCWFPGTRASVLYAGINGRIHRLDFETNERGEKRADGPAIRPRALAWEVPRFPDDAVVRDLTWPADARLGGKLLASISFKRRPGHYGDEQIWWLELDANATKIIAAGPLLETGTPGARRFPNLVGEIDGAPTLAYLAEAPRQTGYQLRVAPVQFGPRTGEVHVYEEEARVLANGCLPALPMGTPDGRGLTVVRAEGQSLKLDRCALDGASISRAEHAEPGAGSVDPNRQALSSPNPQDRLGPEETGGSFRVVGPGRPDLDRVDGFRSRPLDEIDPCPRTPEYQPRGTTPSIVCARPPC